MKNKNYFTICENCGCIKWLDENETTSNELLPDGTLLRNSELPQFNSYYSFPKRIYCGECEKEVIPIYFNEVNKSMRIKIVKMSEDQRKEWFQSFRALKKLEDKKQGINYFLGGWISAIMAVAVATTTLGLVTKTLNENINKSEKFINNDKHK